MTYEEVKAESRYRSDDEGSEFEEMVPGEGEEEPVIQLGFVGPVIEKVVGKGEQEKEGKEDGAFLTKLGGFPAWLYPDAPPLAEDVSCGNCRNPLTFLLQIYTPEDEPASAYHRVLYLLVCPNGACHQKSREQSFKVLRSQLPRDNDIYELIDNEDQDSEGDSEAEEESWKIKKELDVSQKCWVCGLYGNKRCSKCQTALYCSRAHQLLDWNNGQHRTLCKTPNNTSPFETQSSAHFFGFPPRYIDCESEKSSAEMKQDNLKQVQRLMDQVSLTEPPPSNQVMVSGDEKYENTKVEVDQAFLDFQRRISYDQAQVLRYARTHYGQTPLKPLWVSDIGAPKPTDILPCQICGQTRTFEMQILPQLLNFLPIDHKHPHSLDWGTFLIYTCPDNCWPEEVSVSSDVLTGGRRSSPVYVTEATWHQGFSDQGIGENIRRNHF